MTRLEVKPIRSEEKLATFEYYGAEKYTDPDLDDYFKKAEKDSKRKGKHAGWWGIQRMIEEGNREAARALLELPFRYYEEDLHPIEEFNKIVALRENPKDFAEEFKSSEMIYAESKMREFSWYYPEKGINKRFSAFHDSIYSVLSHYTDPKRYPSVNTWIKLIYSK